MSAKQHALYRFYDAGGQLLYVGITVDPAARWRQHGDTKDWWADVRGVSVEWYDTRPEALAAETRAIQIESPLHNIQRPSLPGKHANRRALAVVTKAGPHRLVWICEVCATPVADGTGYLHMEYADVDRYAEEKAAWKAKYDPPREDGFPNAIVGSAFLDYPEDVHWHVVHAACDPRPDSSCYWFGVERARTHAKLLNWTSHLMGKGWLKDTDWDELINRQAGVDA